MSSEFVNKLGAAIQDGYSYNKDTQQVTFKDVEAKVKAALPETISFDTVVQVQDLLIDITAAHTLATGKVGEIELKGQPDNTKLSAKSNVGHSAIETSYWGAYSGTAANKPYRKLGKVTSDFTIGVGRKAAPYKEVQKFLAESAASVFSQ